MKILTLGTCRVLQLFETNINNTFLNSLHYTNYGNYGGSNVISFSHDIYQSHFLLKLIKNNKIIKDPYYYSLFSRLSVFIQDCGDYRSNLLSIIPDYDINNSIENIHNQLNEVEYIILEVCTLKRLIIDGVPMYLDINDQSHFSKITDQEFCEDFDNFVNLVKSINDNIKIIFVSHFISYNNEIIPERLHILNLLKENVKKYNNCFCFCPTDYITDDDLEDNRHYKPESKHKIVNALSDKILEIESHTIVDKMNHTGIMQFNLSKYFNVPEKKAFDTLNLVLNNMTEEITQETYVKKWDENDYMYTVNSHINEPYNLNNPIFVDFFKIMTHDIITKIAKKYLESEVFINNALMAVNYNCSDERVQSQNWHRDPGGRKLIKFFVFFDDIGELNGSLEYIPNSQYTSQSKITNIFDFNNNNSIYPISYSHMKNEYDIFSKVSDNKRLITEAKMGDCISVDTTGFHRAGFCSKNKYRKYLHVLYLTEINIINNTDPGDRYQLGFNHNSIYNVDKSLIDDLLKKSVSKYFYTPLNIS